MTSQYIHNTDTLSKSTNTQKQYDQQFEQQFASLYSKQLNDIENNFFDMIGLQKPEQINSYTVQPYQPEELLKKYEETKNVILEQSCELDIPNEENEKQQSSQQDSQQQVDNKNNNSNVAPNSNHMIDYNSKSSNSINLNAITNIGGINGNYGANGQCEKENKQKASQRNQDQQYLFLTKSLAKRIKSFHINCPDAVYITNDEENIQQFTSNYNWTNEETRLLFDLLSKHGNNFKEIQKNFPNKISKKQIKKKINQERKKNPSKVSELLVKNNKFIKKKLKSKSSISNCSVYDKATDTIISKNELQNFLNDEDDDDSEAFFTDQQSDK